MPSTSESSGATHLSTQYFAEVVDALRFGAMTTAAHERRQVTRIEVQCPIQIAQYVNGGSTDERDVITRDISIGGIGLMQSIPMEPGKQIVVRLPRREKPPLFVLSQVAYAHRLAEGIYGVGARFKRLLNVDISSASTIDQIRQSILR